MKITIKAKVLGIFFVMLTLIVMCQAAVYFVTLDRLHHIKELYDSTVLHSDANNLKHQLLHKMLAMDDYLLFPDENRLGLLNYADNAFAADVRDLMDRRRSLGNTDKDALFSLLDELNGLHDDELKRTAEAGGGLKTETAVAARVRSAERVEKDMLDGIDVLALGRPDGGMEDVGEGWREKAGGLFTSFLPEFEDGSDIRERTRELLEYQDIRNLTMQRKVASRRFLLTGDERYAREFHALGRELDDRVSAVSSALEGGAGQEADGLKFIIEASGEITAAFDRAVRVYRSGDRKEAYATVMGAYVNEEVLDSTVSELVDGEDVQVKSAYNSLDPIMKYSVAFTRALLAYLAIVSLLMAAFVYAAVSRMVRPIVRLGEVSRSIAQGDWTQRLEVRTRDEVGEMAASFNKMTDDLEKAEKLLLRRHQNMSYLYDLSVILGSALSLERMLDDVMEAVMGLMVSQVEPRVSIFMVEGDMLRLASLTGHPAGSPHCGTDVRVGDCLCGLAAKTGEIIISTDSTDDDRHTFIHPGMTPHGHIAVPLKASDMVIGVLSLYMRPGTEIDEDKKRLLHIIGGQIGSAISNAKLYEETKALSLKDALTGLANRRMMDILLDKSFGRARRFGTPFSVIMMDIDFFKKYNDTYGHPAGDALLASIAGILLGEVREIDLVVRYGGEEFFVLLPDITVPEALVVAERIRAKVEAESGVTVSLGVSAYRDEVQSREDVVREADEALYRAKQGGRNRVEAHGPRDGGG
ncbi:MAG: diguanylate cyclase [Nitrospirae bacterium]|nr:diguanylate cyclase [Nitrospirota bacterium]